MKVNIRWGLMLLLVAGCSARPLKPEAGSVMIVINKPDTARCEYLGGIIGSPGNWITEDYASNEVLMLGAGNDLRNQAYDMGGNTIHLRQVDDASAWMGAASISITGLVYRCR